VGLFRKTEEAASVDVLVETPSVGGEARWQARALTGGELSSFRESGI